MALVDLDSSSETPPPAVGRQNPPPPPPPPPPQERQLYDMDDASYPSVSSTEALSTTSSADADEPNDGEAVDISNATTMAVNGLDLAGAPLRPKPQGQHCDLVDASCPSSLLDLAATNSAKTPVVALGEPQPKRKLCDTDDACPSPPEPVNNGTMVGSKGKTFATNQVDRFKAAVKNAKDRIVHHSHGTKGRRSTAAKSFAMTRVDLDEAVVDSNDQASHTDATVRTPRKSVSVLKPLEPEVQQHPRRSHSRRVGCIVACVVVIFVFFAVVLRLVLRSNDGGAPTIAESEENFCRLCPVGFEFETPDAIIDLPTSSSAVKGMKCSEVFEKAQAGEYNTGLYCALVQTEVTAVCPCKKTPPKPGKPTTSPAPTPSPTTSAQPSAHPTMAEFYVPPNPVPENPPKWYFNYNITDKRYGPDGWRKINMGGSYFEEFGENGFGTWDNHLIDHVSDPTTNRCDDAGKQSPVDVIKTTGAGAECTAAHQIRTRPGSLALYDSAIKKLIEPNKLRIDLYRRGCKDFTEDGVGSEACRPRPPIADFPNYSSTVTHHSDLLHLDIKVPSEHTVRGETFDAEIQMMHIHLDASRIGYVGVPIRATVNGYNAKYQALLDQFQIVYDNHKAECAAKLRRRGLRSAPKGFLGRADLEQSSYSDDPAFKRRLQQAMSSKLAFDPHGDFLETVFFYRYNGSSPDPPCFPVTWFVLEKPIHIDFNQLKQTKVLLFTHINANCEKTSVHNEEQSVVRPLQKLGKVKGDDGKDENREIMSCMPGDFPPDEVPVQP